MTVAELQQKSTEELRELLEETRQELRTLRFKASENQLGNVAQIAKTRRIIAQIFTVLGQRDNKNTTHLAA